MTFDFKTQLGAVERSVTALERDGQPARNVTLSRSYATTADDLWQACTDPERLRRWFLPVSGDLQLGGQYQFEGNAGGTITDCEPPHFLGVTWEFGGGMSWVELRISDEGSQQARLTLSHICPLDEHWETYGPGATGVGWDLGLAGLAAFVASESLEGFDEAAFMGSPEGIGFMTGSSESWTQAAIAAGEDPAQAQAAGKRTTAFYTGTDPEAD